MTPEEFVREKRAELLATAGQTGIKVGEWDELVDEALQAAIKAEEVTTPSTLAFVQQQRKEDELAQRSKGADFLLQVAEALSDGTILGLDDPILLRPASVGGGLRKAFKFCDVVDLDEMIASRRNNMARVVAAFDRDAAAVDVIKRAMRAYSYLTVGDAFI
jgi:hypothetical protein